MANGVEILVRSLLSACGVNVADAKKEVMGRINRFEYESQTAIANITAINVNLKNICVKLDIPYIEPAVIEPPKVEAA